MTEQQDIFTATAPSRLPSPPPGKRLPAGALQGRRLGRRFPWVRVILTSLAVLFLSVFVLLPAANVFKEAFSGGWSAYKAAFYPPPIDQTRADAIHARLDAIAELPLRQRRSDAILVEKRNLQREEAEMLAAGPRAEKNWHSIKMTLGIAAVVVPLNVIFGVAAAWSISKFRFKGRSLLVSIIDLPFSVSPVVAGLIFVLLFGAQGFLAEWSRWEKALWLAPTVKALRILPLILIVAYLVFWRLEKVIHWAGGREGAVRIAKWCMIGLILAITAVLVIQGYSRPNPGWAWLLPTEWTWPDPTTLYWRGFSFQHWWPIGAQDVRQGVIFTPIAIVLASTFVTFPFVARTLIPLMESQGADAELAAISLGATGWYAFRRVTLPSIKWGLLYGVILCTARALGEFGAVSVVSGHLDSNDTMPLRIEKLWQESRTQPAFAVASVLAILAVVSLILKTTIEWKTRRDARIGAGVAIGGKGRH